MKRKVSWIALSALMAILLLGVSTFQGRLSGIVPKVAPREDSDEATFTTFDFPGATATTALDINRAGEIVGLYVSAADLRTHGFLRSKNGEFTSIDFPGAVFTRAAGINSRGDIVGWYRLAGVTHGFLLSRGRFTTIDFPGTTITQLLGINPRGDIVGRRCPITPCGRGTHGFLLSRGEFASIDVPGALETHAWKINPRGQIVGGYAGADGENHVFLLREGEFTTIRRDKGFVSLTFLDFDFPGAIPTALDNGGINPRGDIVGFTCDTAPCTSRSGDTHGFLLSRGEFTTIDFLGARQTVAFGINRRGDIAGGYVDTSGKCHGFLLSRREDPDEDDSETIE